MADTATRTKASLDVRRSLGILAISSVLFIVLAVSLKNDPIFGNFADLATSENSNAPVSSWWAEDGVFEYATVGFSAAAAFLWLWATSRARSMGLLPLGRHYVLALLLVFALFFLAGEEFSWGQRIFNLVTPEQLARINLQEETNLHNINSHIPIPPLLYYATLCWGVILPILQMTSRFVHRWVWALRCPVPPLYLASLFVSAPLFRILYFPSYGNPAREGMELIFSAAFMAVAIHAALRPEAVWVKPSGLTQSIKQPA